MSIVPDNLGAGWCPPRDESAKRYRRDDIHRAMALKLGGFSKMSSDEIIERIYFCEDDHILVADLSGNLNCGDAALAMLMEHCTAQPHARSALYALNLSNTGIRGQQTAKNLASLVSLPENDLQILHLAGCTGLSSTDADGCQFWDQFKDMAQSATFFVRELKLDGIPLHVGECAANMINGLKDSPTLESLGLRNTHAATYLNALLQAHTFGAKALKRLDLSENADMDFSVIASILQRIKGGHDSSIVLRTTSGGVSIDAFIARLLEPQLDHIASIDLSGTPLPADAFSRVERTRADLGDAATSRSNMTSVALSATQLSSSRSGLSAFLDAFPSLTLLDLSRNAQLGDSGGPVGDPSVCASIGRRGCLKHLNMGGCGLGDAALVAIAAGLLASPSSLFALVALDLSGNNFDFRSWHAVSMVLATHPQLAAVNLRGAFRNAPPQTAGSTAVASGLFEGITRRAEARAALVRGREPPVWVAKSVQAAPLPKFNVALEGLNIVEVGPFAPVKIELDIFDALPQQQYMAVDGSDWPRLWQVLRAKPLRLPMAVPAFS
jgi:hypothetical protein